MVDHKRKKNTRMRAKTTHGYGSMKKNRGAGHRGGRGRAGSGKRGDAKKPSLQWEKGHKHKGKVGFKTYNKKGIKGINLSFIEEHIQTYISKKLAEKAGDVYKIDLKKLKFNKLLGSGKISYKYEITTDYASDKAIQKVESLGGKVILPKENTFDNKKAKVEVKEDKKVEEKVKEESKE